jgi:hypothetical protein
VTAGEQIVARLLESEDPNALTFWHGARVGRSPGEPGADGLIFASRDRAYAETFVDPMEKHGPEERATHLVQVRVTLRNPKTFNFNSDDEFKAFTERGISAESLRAEGFDGAVLVDQGEIVDVAVVDPAQFEIIRPGAPAAS